MSKKSAGCRNIRQKEPGECEFQGYILDALVLGGNFAGVNDKTGKHETCISNRIHNLIDASTPKRIGRGKAGE